MNGDRFGCALYAGRQALYKPNAQKSPEDPGFFWMPLLYATKGPGSQGLLDLGFLVDHVLANHRIKFLDLHLFRHVALVFVRGVEMAGTGAGNESDFFTHNILS
jgi:hypothetical protein